MPTVDPHLPYQIELAVVASDIDFLGHANNAVYLRWVQDAATAHWGIIASAELQRSLLWVVVKHEIEYKRPAFLHDKIIARTWIGGANRLHFERFTEIERLADSKLLARARTLWCPVDPASLRPVRVSTEVREMFSSDD
jgi:acyl-CoA thioester hydrolase